MRYATYGAILGALALAFVVGCNSGSYTATSTVPAKAAAPDPRFVLASEPPGAQSVIEVRRDAKDGDDVTIVGRIGGDVDPWVKGRAAFVIVDPTLTPCSERKNDSCPTPWDYCCDADHLAEAKATVKFVDDQGQTISTDARQLLGVDVLERVTIRGRAKRDEAGNLTVLASGIYIQH